MTYRSDGSPLPLYGPHPEVPTSPRNQKAAQALLVSIRQAADMLAISRSSIYNLIEADQLGHLVEPRRCATDIERVELFSVVFACVTEDHAPAGSIGAIGPFGAHFLPVGFRGKLRRPPFSKLRFGSTPGASKAVDNRWMVDHRASSRPFSIREISAWATPVRSASSACVQPKSIRRSRIEPPGLVSPAMVARSVMQAVYVAFHIDGKRLRSGPNAPADCPGSGFLLGGESQGYSGMRSFRLPRKP